MHLRNAFLCIRIGAWTYGGNICESKFRSPGQRPDLTVEKENNMGMQESSKLQMFEDQPIRTAWDEEREEWYFSVVDVIGALTESADPAAYWRKLKQRLKAEGNETVTNCHGLKMKAADGKHRMTDVANTEQLLRLIQSIPSKKAEPFKLWLAM